MGMPVCGKGGAENVFTYVHGHATLNKCASCYVDVLVFGLYAGKIPCVLHNVSWQMQAVPSSVSSACLMSFECCIISQWAIVHVCSTV